MPKYVPKIELARIAGVTKGAITKASIVAFPQAVDGNLVDLDHPDVQRYLAKRANAPIRAVHSQYIPASAQTAVRPKTTIPPASVTTPEPAKSGPKRPAVAKPEPVEAPGVTGDELEGYAHWPLENLVRKFGTARDFIGWLDAWKRIAETRDKTLRLEERLGRLISRDFVEKYVFAHLRMLHTRLLTDTVSTMARRLYSEMRAGRSVEELEGILREHMGSQLDQAKKDVARMLGEAREVREAAA
jgi:hypothetical protein